MGEVKEESVDETKTRQLLMAQVKEEKVDETHFWNMLMTLPPEQTTQFCNQVLKPSQEYQGLNLSLTLGSVYCEESKDYQLLSRSSSTIEMTALDMDSGNADSSIPETYLSLVRACSLPAETEQKEVPAGAANGVQRTRAESGRRLMKQRSARARVDKSSSAETMPNSPSKIPAWAAASAAKSPAFCRAIVKLKAHNSLPAEAQPQVVAQVSAANKTADTAPGLLTKQAILQAFKDAKAFQDSHRKLAHPSKKPKLPKNNSSEENAVDMIQKMPSVTTTGPTGKQIEGVLYMYRRNQVNIVCICHGRFMTPAEFVRHAGGKDVENPMKHIKVRPAFF